MLEVKFSINGSPIKQIFAHNLGVIEGVNGTYLYEYEVYSPFDEETVVKGTIAHNRIDKAEVLVYKILKKVLNDKTKRVKSKKL